MSRSVFLLLGSNESDRAAQLATARMHLADSIGQIVAASSIYQTAPWGETAQADFFNQVVEVDTALEPEAVLQGILSIEQVMGRKRARKWGPRIIDIDILLYGNRVIDTPSLKIPHPCIANRRFTLVPLAEIAAAVVHPNIHRTIAELLLACDDALAVQRVN